MVASRVGILKSFLRDDSEQEDYSHGTWLRYFSALKRPRESQVPLALISVCTILVVPLSELYHVNNCFSEYQQVLSGSHFIRSIT